MIILILAASGGTVAAQQSHGGKASANRAEKFNKDFYLHKKFYPPIGTPEQDARKIDPRVGSQSESEDFAPTLRPWTPGLLDHAKQLQDV